MLGDRAVSPTTRLRLRHDSMDVEVGSCPVSLSAELSPLFADMPMSDCEKSADDILCRRPNQGNLVAD